MIKTLSNVKFYQTIDVSTYSVINIYSKCLTQMKNNFNEINVKINQKFNFLNETPFPSIAIKK